MKKRAEMSTLTKALLAIFILIILIVIFRNQIFPESQIIDNTICGVDADQDGDGVPDLIDDCICVNEDECKTPEGKAKCKEDKEKKCSKT